MELERRWKGTWRRPGCKRGCNGEGGSNGEKVKELDGEGPPVARYIYGDGVPVQRALHGKRLLVKSDLLREWIWVDRASSTGGGGALERSRNRLGGDPRESSGVGMRRGVGNREDSEEDSAP